MRGDVGQRLFVDAVVPLHGVGEEVAADVFVDAVFDMKYSCRTAGGSFRPTHYMSLKATF